MIGFVALVAAAMQPAATVAYDRYLHPGTMVEVAPRRRLNLRCEGKGRPTILLEAGLGFPSISWREVQPRLARTARTCAYDRAGLGFSDPGPMPRSALTAVRDLEALVAAAKLPPPYLLVGNSMGGQIVRLFAFRNPHQTAGLVLLDPYVEGQYPALSGIDPSIGTELRQLAREESRCVDALRKKTLSATAAEQRECIVGPNSSFSPALNVLLRRQRMHPAGFEAAYSESRMLETVSERQLAAARRSLGRIPVIVLSASGNFSSPRFAKTRSALLTEQHRLHRRLAAVSACGEVRSVASGHVVQTSKPEAVVAAVQSALRGCGR